LRERDCREEKGKQDEMTHPAHASHSRSRSPGKMWREIVLTHMGDHVKQRLAAARRRRRRGDGGAAM